MLARSEAAFERSGRIRERERRVDRDAKLAAVHKARELDQLVPVRFDDEVAVPRPPSAAPRPPRRDGRRRRQRRCAFEELAANCVEDHINRLPFVELCAARRRPHQPRVSEPARSVRGRARDHVSAAPASELSRELADAANRSVDEHPLAGLESSMNEQALPGAKRRKGTAALSAWPSVDGLGASVHAGTAAYSAATPSRRTVLTRTPRRQPRPHRRRLRPPDDTGELVRGNGGESVERPLELVASDCGGMHLDERFAELERRRVDRLVVEALDSGRVSRIASIVAGSPPQPRIKARQPPPLPCRSRRPPGAADACALRCPSSCRAPLATASRQAQAAVPRSSTRIAFRRNRITPAAVQDALEPASLPSTADVDRTMVLPLTPVVGEHDERDRAVHAQAREHVG